MYKLFLCFRYLRSKILPYLAILVVAFCVWLLLTWVSIMSGFLEKIELAAKGLFGDIVIESSDQRGLAHFDEFIAIINKELSSDIESAGPFILSMGAIRVEDNPDFREYVQIAGIRLPDRIKETDFEDGLFIQEGLANPTFDPPLELLRQKIMERRDALKARLFRDFAEEITKLPQKEKALTKDPKNWLALLDVLGKVSSPEKQQALRRMRTTAIYQLKAIGRLRWVDQARPRLKAMREKIAEAKKQGASQTQLDQLQEDLETIEDSLSFEDPKWRIILGLGIRGLSYRADDGEIVRILVPGHRVVLYVLPIGSGAGLMDLAPNTHKFTIIDDNSSGVSNFDSKIVYIPFDTLQEMNNMGPQFASEGGEIVVPPRCSQIHIKVTGQPDEQRLRDVSKKILTCWERFEERYSELAFSMKPALSEVMVQTWRERQASVIEPLEKQRILAVSITCIMSIVGVTVIFIILYTLVAQKTRDIGVLKAVGASNGGVAGLFFFYGGLIGAVGAAMGLTMSYYTVLYINNIQDVIAEVFGFRLWTADSFMFENIPSQMDWNMACWVVGGAILSGLLGAMAPAISAAKMQPVDALRYE